MKYFFEDTEIKIQLEKLVIGLEEPILVKGIGEIIAKIDSGNNGYNVIHGEDLYQQGDILTFITYNKDGERRNVSKKIIDNINVNIGSGNIQDRPVINLDIKFANEEYKKIPFSVTDRGDNSHKILICKDFIKDELDALIDVNATNLSSNPINVNYDEDVSESAIVKNMKDLKKYIRHYNSLKAKEKREKDKEVESWFSDNEEDEEIEGNNIKSYEDKIETSPNLFKKFKKGFDIYADTVAGDWYKHLMKDEQTKVRKYITNDPKLIREKIFRLNDVKNTVENQDDIKVFKILDFNGGTFSTNDTVKMNDEIQSKLDQALNNKDKNNQEVNSTENNEPIKNEETEESKKLLRFYQNRKNFILYYACYLGEKEDLEQALNNSTTFNDLSIRFLQKENEFVPGQLENIVNVLNHTIKDYYKNTKIEIKGNFVVLYEKNINEEIRSMFIYKNLKNINTNINKLKEIENKYKELADKYEEITGKKLKI